MLPALLALLACSGDEWEVDSGGVDSDPPTIVPDWVVDCEGGGDFPTIQEAIDAAANGDRIALAACTYHERIDYSAKTLDIYGVDGPEVTVIDGDLGGTVVRVVSGESLGTRLAGVTVRGGYNPSFASAIAVYQSSLRLDQAVLAGNGEAGSVLYAGDAFITANGLTVSDNATSAEGMAIYSSGGGLVGEDMDVDCDGASYGVYQHNAATIDRSAFTCARGYAFYSLHGELRAWRSSFTGGLAGIYAEETGPDTSQRVVLANVYATGATGVDVRYLTMQITNSVLAGTEAGLNVIGVDAYSYLWNSIVLDSACGLQGDGGALTVYYTNFWNNLANTCAVTADVPYATDPRFVDYPSDLTLDQGSPMIDAGEPTWFDPDGSRSDVGVFGGPNGSWGK
ncbi:MAG: hypothetical protein Q8P41_11630 [Pseudomonadota bacterium]|nr:hypothetical protein [Pseudomonadota bacterium]